MTTDRAFRLLSPVVLLAAVVVLVQFGCGGPKTPTGPTTALSVIPETGRVAAASDGIARSVAFPPRNEPFAFRQELEAKYRDGLGRQPQSTFVDLEGDIVWITEYTRYRVNNCSHAEATTRVFAQIDGRGVAPTCAAGSASGWISDLQAARDIIDWNMAAAGGTSFRKQDRICRWELPVPVYLQDGPDRDRVIAALDYWRDQAGMSYRLIPSDVLPRLLIRFGMDGLPPWGGGRALVDGTNANNSSKSALAVYQPGGGTYCQLGTTTAGCLMLYRHELGHTLGIYINTPVGLMGGAVELSDREKRMMAALYALPHGARVEADGTWQVLPQ